jgi:lactate permease
MKWVQIYDPFGSIVLSTLVAAIPLLVLAYCLGVRRMSSHVSVTVGLVLTFLVAGLGFRMPWLPLTSSLALGCLVGLWSSLLLIAAIAFYQVLDMTGQFAIIRRSISALTSDPRLQILLVGFCFGSFLEAIAGGGTPVAITVAMLVGLGFGAFYSAKLCLLCNSTPVAFGAVGLPLFMTGLVTGLPLMDLSSMAGRQIPVVSLLIPVLLIVIMSGWKGVASVWPAIVVTSLVFSGTQCLVANTLGPYLPDVLASVAVMIALVLLLSVWQPKEEWRLPVAGGDPVMVARSSARPRNAEPPLTPGEVVRAWLPVLVMVIVVGIWGFPQTNSALMTTDLHFVWPGLHNLVYRVPPLAAQESPYAAVFNFNWLSAPGTALMIATLASALLVKGTAGFAVFGRAVGRSVYQLRFGNLTYILVTGMAWMMNYSGITATVALAFAMTGFALPFFSAFMGWVAVFVTGSDTNAAALFGNLQAVAAHQAGFSPLLSASTNIAGGATAKMLSPLELAVATSSGGLSGREGDLFRQVLPWSLGLTAIVGLVALAQAYVFTWMIP